MDGDRIELPGTGWPWGATAIAASAIAAIALAIGAFVLWPTGGRRLAAARDTIRARRAQYCRIARALEHAPSGANDLRSPGASIILPGYLWPDAPHVDRPNLDANADGIGEGELLALCGERDPSASDPAILRSLLADLAIDPDSPRAGDYEVEGVEDGLRLLDRLRYLLVVRTRSRIDSRVDEAGNLQPGQLHMTAFLFRLGDARSFGSVDVQANAPGTALVFVRQNAYGSAAEDEMNSAVRASDSTFYQDLLIARFAERGVTLVDHRDEP